MVLFNAIAVLDSFSQRKDLTEAVGELMARYNYEWLSAALVIFFAFVSFFAQEN